MMSNARTPLSYVAAAIVLFAGLACDGSGAMETGESGDSGDTPLAEGALTIDATEQEGWVYLDLETLEEVTPATPADSDEWDLGFQRYSVSSNGGTSGSGGVEVAVLEGVDFDTLTSAPADGYIADAVEGTPDGMSLEQGYAFDGWFDYSPVDHTLSANGTVFVVRTVEENYFKVELLDYYDMAGTSGHVTLQVAPIDPPQ